MTDSLLIGKIIYSKLRELTDNVYPVVADLSTKYPFIIYYRTGVAIVSYSKDGYCEDLVNFTICCVSDVYMQSLDLAQKVREKMETLRMGNITSVMLTGCDEAYEDNTYVLRLNFECKVNN